MRRCSGLQTLFYRCCVHLRRLRVHRPSYGLEPANGEFFGVCDAVLSWIESTVPSLTLPRPTQRPIRTASRSQPRPQANALSPLLIPEQLGDGRGARRIPPRSVKVLTAHHRN